MGVALWVRKTGRGISQSRPGWLLSLICLVGVLGTFPAPVPAQEEEREEENLPPLVVINSAGVDRILGDVNYMFKTIGRDDLSEVVEGFLGNVGDLKGLDRKKSLGVMLYLKPGLTPGVEPVGYVPVDNIDDLLETIQLGPVQTKNVPGEEGRYEIEGPRRTLHVQLQGGYAFVSNGELALDRKLPNPATLTEALTTRYDLAASLNIEGFPEGMRTIFLDFLRAQTEAELQQRDDEPDAAYRARKAAGRNNLHNIEVVLNDGKSLTLGLDASQESQAVVIELEVKAKPSSSFARQLKQFPGKPSVFANVYSEKIPLAATGSWTLQKNDKETFSELIKALDAGLKENLRSQNLDPAPVGGIINSLESTVNSGAVDFFLQFVGEPPGKFVLLGGLKVDHAGDFSNGLQGVLQQLSEQPDIAELEINAERHKGVGLHRVLGKEEGERRNERIYGGTPALYVGAGRGAVWFALGREKAAEQLKTAMTEVETVPEEPRPADATAPFQMVLNLSSWVGLNPEGGGRIRQAARDAFKPENDRLRITARPIEDGFRFKLRFDEGFIRFLGLRMSERLDRSQL